MKRRDDMLRVLFFATALWVIAVAAMGCGPKRVEGRRASTWNRPSTPATTQYVTRMPMDESPSYGAAFPSPAPTMAPVPSAVSMPSPTTSVPTTTTDSPPPLPAASGPSTEMLAQAKTELAEIAKNQEQPKTPVVEPVSLSPDGTYIVRPGDELDIVYREAWGMGSDYRLLAGDQLRVEFLSDDEPALRDRSLPIQPDGKMTLPYVGEVRAAGLTVVELTSQLIERYREYYVEPSILVTLVSTGEGLRRLRSSLESAGSRATLVGPDGRIVLAYLEPMKASGLTLTEIQDEINERYRRAMPGVAVTVRLAGRR